VSTCWHYTSTSRGDNPFSDACLIAMDYGREKIIKEDWEVDLQRRGARRRRRPSPAVMRGLARNCRSGRRPASGLLVNLLATQQADARPQRDAPGHIPSAEIDQAVIGPGFGKKRSKRAACPQGASHCRLAGGWPLLALG